jgi:prepilin-type N-terminal cleavage/methylation domain-containing protein
MTPSAATKFAGRLGFTLVELMICLVITATLSAMAVTRLRPARGGLSLHAALATLEAQDHLMRDRSQRSGRPGELLFDLPQARVMRTEASASAPDRSTTIFSGPDGPRVEQVRVLGSERAPDGRYRITCFGRGRTASYAVLLAVGGQRHWVVVSGLTGQFESVQDEAQVQDIFNPIRHDAR